ncbi:MAG: hypothetical protein ACR2K1_02040 [Saprospiraceae bacterium]
MYSKLTYSIFIAFLCALLGVQCRKDVEYFRAYPPSVTEIRQTLAQVPDPATRSVFALQNLRRDTVLTTAGGLRLILNDTESLFEEALSGAPIPCSACVGLTLEVIEVLEKGDMLARELPAATQQGDPLECAFMVFLRFSCDGKEIKPRAGRSVKIQVPAALPTAGLSLWQGSANITELAEWGLASDSADIYTAEWPAGGSPVSGYELVAKNTGWLCAGKIQSGQRTNYCAQMPPGFDAENSQVFLLLKNSRSVFRLQPNTDNNLFCVEGVPAGLPVQLITISKLGAQFLLGNTDAQTDANSKVVVTPKYATPAEIIQLIKNL